MNEPKNGNLEYNTTKGFPTHSYASTQLDANGLYIKNKNCLNKQTSTAWNLDKTLMRSRERSEIAICRSKFT